MDSTLLAFLGSAGLILAAELPDKTMVTTLVLTTRFRALPVFIGVCAAFAAQCIIAILFGRVITLLPDDLVAVIVAAMFGIGAFLLLRAGFTPAITGDEDASRSGARPISFLPSALTSFGVIFAAEWGDASQLAIAGLSAHYANPWAVGLGSFAALACIAGAAILVGHKLRGRIRPKSIQRIAGFIFAGLSALALASLL